MAILSVDRRRCISCSLLWKSCMFCTLHGHLTRKTRLLKKLSVEKDKWDNAKNDSFKSCRPLYNWFSYVPLIWTRFLRGKIDFTSLTCSVLCSLNPPHRLTSMNVKGNVSYWHSKPTLSLQLSCIKIIQLYSCVPLNKLLNDSGA